MKVITYGKVIIESNTIRVKDWNVAREPSDPPDADFERLLLSFAINWAQDRMRVELKKALSDVVRSMVAKKKSETIN